MNENISGRGWAFTQLAATQVIIASMLVANKTLTAVVPVFLGQTLRFAVAIAILLPLVLTRLRNVSAISRRNAMMFFLQAFFGIFLFNVFHLYGMKYTGATEGGIVVGAIPALIGGLSWLFLREKVKAKGVIGILFTAAGIGAISFEGASTAPSGPNPLLGNLLVLGTAFGEAMFVTIGKKATERHEPLIIATAVSLFGFLQFLPFGIYEAAIRDISTGTQFDWTSPNLTHWLLIAYQGAIVTVGGFTLWHTGLKKVPASVAAVFFGLLPVSTVALSYLFLDNEMFQWSHVAGLACVVAGILAVAWPKRDERQLL